MTPHAIAHPVRYWTLLLTAAAILMITMGIRQTMGLFVCPSHRDASAS